jgi:hypothetical protein
VLKKAGIVVAAAAAGLLALSPLAFADEVDSIEYTNVEEGNLTNDCEFSQAGPDIDATTTGGSSLLGIAGLATQVIAPVTTQAQALNCTNIGISDVIDSDSNNVTSESSRTEIEDSFNDTFED